MFGQDQDCKTRNSICKNKLSKTNPLVIVTYEDLSLRINIKNRSTI